VSIGSLPIAFALSTGTISKTGANLPSQARVYCGFCRDDATNGPGGTGCFEGDPRLSPQCPSNNGCVSAGSPYNCCTGPTAGTCSPVSTKTCTSDADCTDGSGTWPNCEQHNPGAFGFGSAKTITENGSPAGSLTDGNGHASTLVSIFCVPPTFTTSVDNTGDLPGPGAVSLPGTAQLLP